MSYFGTFEAFMRSLRKCLENNQYSKCTCLLVGETVATVSYSLTAMRRVIPPLLHTDGEVAMAGTAAVCGQLLLAPVMLFLTAWMGITLPVKWPENSRP